MTTTIVRANPSVTTPVPREPFPSRLKLFLCLLGVALAAIQAWNGRHALNPDGLSYLEIGQAYLRGDWHAAVNTYWSPLYSWLLAAGLAVLRPSPYWEFAAVKAVNFVIFLAALAAFEWFLRELLLLLRARRVPDGRVGLPESAVVAFAYVLFLWSSCVATTLALTTPDLLVSVFVYLAAAWTLRARRTRPGLVASLTLGLILGAAYLAKAGMGPVGVLFLATSAVAVGSVRKAAVHLAAAGVVCALVAGSYVGLMSAEQGRFTLGDVAKLNYLWNVNKVPEFGCWTDDPGLAAPTHPPRASSTEPPVYEFAEPVAGSFPLWNDPAYWCEGLKGRFNLTEQWAATLAAGRDLGGVFLDKFGLFWAALAVLYAVAWLTGAGGWRDGFKRQGQALADQYPLLIPALGTCAMYSLVAVESRYLAGFIVLLGTALLCAFRYPESHRAELKRLCAALALVLVISTGWLLIREGNLAVRGRGEGEQAHPDWQVAQALGLRGARPGARLGLIGPANQRAWAHVGGYRITAEVRPRDEAAFWQADAARQAEILDAFRRDGVIALVARRPRPGAAGWEAVPGTEFAVRMLEPPTAEQTLARGGPTEAAEK